MGAPGVGEQAAPKSALVLLQESEVQRARPVSRCGTNWVSALFRVMRLRCQPLDLGTFSFGAITAIGGVPRILNHDKQLKPFATRWDLDMYVQILGKSPPERELGSVRQRPAR